MDKLIGIVIAVIIAFFVWHVNHRMNVTADVRRATLGGSARAVFDGLTGAEETFAAGISDGSANDPSPVRAACSGLAGGL